MKRIFATTAGLVLMVAACGGGDASPTTAAPAAEPEATAAPEAEPEATAAPEAEPEATDSPSSGTELQVADTESGEVLVDGDGFALYLFTPDEQGPATCADECASLWPAMSEANAGDGVDQSLLGTADGVQGEQVTYNGWPLYYYAQDASPGDLNGQGVNGVWYLVDPSGIAVTEQATSDSEGASDIYSEPGY